MTEEIGQLIFQAIIFRNLDLLTELIEANDVNNKLFLDNEGKTPLHVASECGYTESIELLTDTFPSSINYPANSHCLLKTPVHLAAEKGFTEIVEILIKKGADLFLFDKDGHTALHLAQINSKAETSNIIISHFQSVQELTKKLRNIFLKGAEDGMIENMEEVFLQVTPNIESKVLNGELNSDDSVFFNTIKNGHLTFGSELLKFREHSLQESETGDTVLHVAIRTGKYQIIELVLENFSFLMGCKNRKGKLPLHEACEMNDVTILKTLLNFPYSSDFLNEVDFPGSDCTYKFVCDLNEIDGELSTPLLIAVKNNNVLGVHFFLEFKVNGKTEDGKDIEICPFVLDSYDCKGKTSLMIACANNNEPILRLLLQSGANPNLPIGVTDDDIQNMSSSTEEVLCCGSGALIEACKIKNITFIKILLHYGAYDHENKALRLASTLNYDEIISLFLSKLVRIDNDTSINKRSLHQTSNIPVPCILNWRQANLLTFPADFIFSAVHRISPKIKSIRGAFASLTKVDLSENLLETIPLTLFSLPSMKCLNLSNNKISSFESLDNFQCNVPVLENISLENNKLTSLPPQLFSITYFPSIKILNVSKNQLKYLPSNIWSSSSLKELNVSHNDLHELPSIVISFDRIGRSENTSQKRYERQKDIGKNIEDLLIPKNKNLKDNEVLPSEEILPENVIEISLERVNRWQNSLSLLKFDLEEEEVVGDKSEFNSLFSLNLSYNKFKEMPLNLACVCPRLVKLDISNNELQSIGPIECLPHRLRSLDISCNKLTKTFDAMTKHHLNCYSSPVNNSNNNSRRSRSKSVARNRRSLSTARNPISQDITVNKTSSCEVCIHKEHKQLEYLKNLNISSNKIRNIPIFLPSLCITSPPEDVSTIKNLLIFPNISTIDLSNNLIDHIPSSISNLNVLTSINLQNNIALQVLPSELGLLDKLWSLQLKGCPIKDYQIKSIIEAPNYKTVDVLAQLRSRLEDSRLYYHLKLMILGEQNSGKSSLLQNIIQEGTLINKKINQTSSSQPSSIMNMYEFTLDPFKKSKNEQSNGPIIFKAWDMSGQKELINIQQYFITRRSIFIVTWNVNSGEHAFNVLEDFLIKIQIRSPNAPVIIVGTHVDEMMANSNKFPDDYLQYLEKKIKEKFINITDSDKKGLPKVYSTLFISNKTKDNIKQLISSIYKGSFEVRIGGSRIKTLEQKIPSTYMTVEKIVLKLKNLFVVGNREPIIQFNDLKFFINEKMIEKNGKSFRNDTEFNNVISFLHDNGIFLHFDDLVLHNFIILDVEWFYEIICKIILSKDLLQNNGVCDRNTFYKISSNIFSTMGFKKKSTKSSGKSGSLLLENLFDIFHKYELGLLYQNKNILIPSLLPEEYQLRAGYPGSSLKIKVKFNLWNICMSKKLIEEKELLRENLIMTTSIISPKIQSIVNKFSLDEAKDVITRSFKKKKIDTSIKLMPSLNIKNDGYSLKSMEDIISFKMSMKKIESNCITRIFLLQYIPYGFWSRLLTRILDDHRITNTIPILFHTNKTSISCKTMNDFVNDKFNGADWNLWQTGIECTAFSEVVFSLKQYLPMADCNDISYDKINIISKDETDKWRNFSHDDFTIIEFKIPYLNFNIVINDRIGTFETNPFTASQLLSIISNNIDTLLEDWYPSLGTRFVHTSKGKFLVNRLVPCNKCLMEIKNPEKIKKIKDDIETGGKEINPFTKCRPTKSTTMYNMSTTNFSKLPFSTLHTFSIEECILKAHDCVSLKCPIHNTLSIDTIAPDTKFLDIPEDLIIVSENLRKSKLIGRGAFGFVYRGSLILKNDFHPDAALKMLEPVDPGINVDDNTLNTYKISQQMWNRDPLQHCCKAYCSMRQELSVLVNLKHIHITSLLGVCVRPLTLAFELASIGSLDVMLSNYRKSGLHLRMSVIQETVVQISKALEYLHLNHIIYRDLKSENVLVWQFPPPFATLNDVSLKLGDFGISRYSNGSEKCKGFGGTEGFMAPEIIQWNGEQEYSEKVDCYSFGMFIYELISLRLPFEGQEQFRERILEGARPQLFESDLLNPNNFLDLMITCWSTNPSDRPSLSEIVSITTAPEFRLLLDVVMISETHLEMYSNGISFLHTVTSSNNIDQSFEELVGSFWMTVDFKNILSTKYNATGFMECKSLIIKEEKIRITAMLHFENYVLVADSNEYIKIYSEENFIELASWPLAIINEKNMRDKKIDIVTKMIEMPNEKNIIVIGMQNSILIVSLENGYMNPKLISKLNVSNMIFTLTIPKNKPGNREIWSGHDLGLIYCHILNESYQFTYSSSMTHSPSNIGAIQKMYSSTISESSVVWSGGEIQPIVFLWEDRKIKKYVDCKKILPSSESLSSMDLEYSKEVKITSMALMEQKFKITQLFVGTSKGVLIIFDGFKLSPLYAMRPYIEEISVIQILSNPQLSKIVDSRGNSIEGQNFNTNTSTMSKESNILRHSTTSIESDKMSKINPLESLPESYCVITVGKGYRPLIERFIGTKNFIATSEVNTNLILWRTDDYSV
ncbi:Leucine-rich repeat kinase [Strongyloides ratti]|uniref:non-specific serine/threonine protein kinase n=1 Tax=Strongyloides ratti TaxID=34506 RepID=A0A090L497_STRRB|nr:Leucine-rich repeat kinase [Strongyloides ratti]CEF64626.1 Leucine-rich repeat kinase [Strongyloides ratti]